MMPLVMSEDDMSALAHGIVVGLPLWVALVVVAIVSLYVVIVGR